MAMFITNDYSILYGLHLNMVEDIMRRHGDVGYHGGFDWVIDGSSPLPDTLLTSFTDRQSIFHASSQPHRQSGRLMADHNGDLGRQGEADPVQGAVGCSIMLGWWADGYATDGS
jgi:hypothetical protein